jgi:hypothetical protein
MKPSLPKPWNDSDDASNEVNGAKNIVIVEAG